MIDAETSGYRWKSAEPDPSHEYLLPTVLNELARATGEGTRVFDLGCGNGSVANVLAQQGWDVTGVDPSAEGIAQANESYPHLKLYEGSGYDDLSGLYGSFHQVICLEVVE